MTFEMGTMGRHPSRGLLCYKCRKWKMGELFTFDANNQQVCPDCAGAFISEAVVLRSIPASQPSTPLMCHTTVLIAHQTYLARGPQKSDRWRPEGVEP